MLIRPLRITILDDDQSVRTAISRLLRTSEISVSLCATGVELFSALDGERPDCLVLDLQMPGMGGLDVMNYLAEIGVSIPTVIITAHDEPGSRETCLAAGALAYLRKPLDADELLLAIERAAAGSLAVLGPRSN
jgi:CheY-like chemotaxis protein